MNEATCEVCQKTTPPNRLFSCGKCSITFKNKKHCFECIKAHKRNVPTDECFRAKHQSEKNIRRLQQNFRKLNEQAELEQIKTAKRIKSLEQKQIQSQKKCIEAFENIQKQKAILQELEQKTEFLKYINDTTEINDELMQKIGDVVACTEQRGSILIHELQSTIDIQPKNLEETKRLMMQKEREEERQKKTPEIPATFKKCYLQTCTTQKISSEVKYIHVKCSAGCRFQYHVSCYRSLTKRKLSLTDEQCLTPDCTGELIKISVMQMEKERKKLLGPPEN